MINLYAYLNKFIYQPTILLQSYSYICTVPHNPHLNTVVGSIYFLLGQFETLWPIIAQLLQTNFINVLPVDANIFWVNLKSYSINIFGW